MSGGVKVFNMKGNPAQINGNVNQLFKLIFRYMAGVKGKRGKGLESGSGPFQATGKGQLPFPALRFNHVSPEHRGRFPKGGANLFNISNRWIDCNPTGSVKG
jgi:hypothetical protein